MDFDPNLYDEICRVLTEYEHNGEEETNFIIISPEDFNKIFYNVLLKVVKELYQ